MLHKLYMNNIIYNVMINYSTDDSHFIFTRFEIFVRMEALRQSTR